MSELEKHKRIYGICQCRDFYEKVSVIKIILECSDDYIKGLINPSEFFNKIEIKKENYLNYYDFTRK